MRTGDREYPLVGRIRSWDALIILLRLPVSPLLFISRQLFHPLRRGFRVGPGHFSPFYFSFPDPLIEFTGSWPRSLILISQQLTNSFELRALLPFTAPFFSVVPRSICPVASQLTSPHLVARHPTGIHIG